MRERNSEGSFVSKTFSDSNDTLNLSAQFDLINDSNLSISSYDLPTDENKLNIISFNVAGLISKLDDNDFVQFLENFDIVCLLETIMINNTIPKTMFNSFLPAFFYPATKSTGQGRNAGGIVVLVKMKFKKMLSRVDFEFPNGIVLLFRNIFKNDKTDLVFISTYIHPYGSPIYNNFESNNGIEIFENSFYKLQSKYSNCQFLLAGDFNARIGNIQPCEEIQVADKYYENANSLSFFDHNANDNLRRKSEDTNVNIFGRSLIEFVSSYNMIVVNGIYNNAESSLFTYLSSTGYSVVDYFIISDTMLENCVKMNVASRVESDHMPILLSIHITDNTSQMQHKQEELNFVKWDDEKLDQFKKEMCSNNFRSYIDNLESNIETDINTCIRSLCDFYLDACHMMKKPFKNLDSQKSKKYSKISYFDKECFQMKLCLRKYLRKYKKCKSDENKNNYAKFRKEYKQLLALKRQQFNKNKIQSILNKAKDSKLFWKEIKSITITENKYNSIDINSFYTYFKSVFQNNLDPPPICYENVIHPYSDLKFSKDSYFYLNNQITTKEVRETILNLKLNKSPGHDGILNEMLKHTSEDIIPFLTTLFQHIFENKIFPNEWTKSVIVPIHKKGDLNTCSNFRPISLTSILSKIYTSILEKRLNEFIETNNILPIEQAGFRKKQSTVDHIFTLYAMITKQLSMNRKLYVAFVDYSRCYDTINKNALFTVLERNGISGNFLDCIKSIYASVSACIRNNGEFSEYFECPIGLKQGCLLSPRLFLIFISEVSRAINLTCSSGIQFLSNFNIIHHLFWADDIILVSDTPQGLQDKLNVLEKQSKRLGITVNLDKTKIIVFRKGGFLSRFEKWYYGANPVEVVNSYTYLGFVFTTKMSMKTSLSFFILKAKNALNTLFRSLNSIDCHDNNIFFNLFDRKIAPILSYSSELWGIYDIDDIESVHRLAIKRYLNISNHSLNSIAYSEVGRVPLHINHTISSVKYWLKLIKKPDSCLSKQAYLMLLRHCEEGKDNWVTRIKRVLCENGFGFLWMCENVSDENYVLTELKSRLTDIFIQTWNMKMSNNVHCEIYYSFKSMITPELYLSSRFYDTNLRISLTRFRCGVSHLNAHRYRFYTNLNLKNCPFCPDKIENEMHVLFFCKAYTTIRKKFIHEKFLQKANLHTLAILISNEKYQFTLSKYLYAMFTKRKQLLGN